ncbi:HAD-IA family hydrolase [Candidatus Woesearchaeota archaeon]|nr:HAD-IA family hydrolase [Candidatus Woesearchaeota archaeon]
MIKAIIFDFWGTLMEQGVNPSPFKQAKYFFRIKAPFSEFAPKFEKAFMTEYFDSLSEGFRKVSQEFSLNPPDFVYEKLVGVWNKNKLLAKPYPETLDALTELKKKYRLALVASTDCFSVNEVIDKYDLRKYFDVIALSYETGLLKTDKKMFQHILKKLKVTKDEAVMVGDSIESDMVGAEAAGISSVLVDRKDKREYPNKILDLTQVKDVVPKLK